MTPPVAASAPAGRSLPAGFWVRVAALVIDGFVMVGIGLGGAALFGLVGAMLGSPLEFAVAGYYIVYLLAAWLYFALCESSVKQATLGKRAVGIFVTDGAGRRLTFARATGRAFAKYLNTMTLGIGWLMTAFTGQKQGLHDFVAGTLVIRRGNTNSGALVAVVCVLAMIPVTGIIAAIAIPGLLRARMSANEAAAIGSLRSIVSAQDSYSAHCGGYAPNLQALGPPRNYLDADMTAAETITKSGYRFTLGGNGAEVQNAPAGCQGAVTEYSVEAQPVTPGSTGIRYFSVGTTGTIYQDTSAAFNSAQPLE